MTATGWRGSQASLLILALVAIVLVPLSTLDQTSNTETTLFPIIKYGIMVATKNSNDAIFGHTDKVLVMGLMSFCKQAECVRYSEYAISPAATAAAKHIKQREKNIIEADNKLARASINSTQDSKSGGSRGTIQLTNLEKVAIVCISGTGPAVAAPRYWITLPILLGISAVLVLVHIVLFCFLAWAGKENKENGRNQEPDFPEKAKSGTSSVKATKYVMMASQGITLVLLAAALIDTGVTFAGKAKEKLGEVSWGGPFFALVAAVVLVFISALLEMSVYGAKLKRRYGQGDNYSDSNSWRYS